MAKCRDCKWYEPEDGDNNSNWGYCPVIHEDVKWNDSADDHDCGK